MKTLFASFILIFFLNSFTFATEQIPDTLIYEGKSYPLYMPLMKGYFIMEPLKKPKITLKASNLNRGYVATFEIINNELYLKDIQIMSSSNTWQSVLNQVIAPEKKLKIYWSADILVLPYGNKIKEAVYPRLLPEYSNYVVLEAQIGKITSLKKFSHEALEAFKDAQYKAYIQTNDYKTLIEDFKEEGNYDEKKTHELIRQQILDLIPQFLEIED